MHDLNAYSHPLLCNFIVSHIDAQQTIAHFLMLEAMKENNTHSSYKQTKRMLIERQSSYVMKKEKNPLVESNFTDRLDLPDLSDYQRAWLLKIITATQNSFWKAQHQWVLWLSSRSQAQYRRMLSVEEFYLEAYWRRLSQRVYRSAPADSLAEAMRPAAIPLNGKPSLHCIKTSVTALLKCTLFYYNKISLFYER